MGWLVTSPTPTATSTTTAASVALRALAAGRAEGLTDDEIVAATRACWPWSRPGSGPPSMLPPTPAGLGRARRRRRPTGAEPDRAAVLREALRLRARWVQELTARAAGELGGAWRPGASWPTPPTVRHLRLAELVDGRAHRRRLPDDMRRPRPARRAAPRSPPGSG